MFGYEWAMVLQVIPWFALACWVANDDEDMSRRRKLVESAVWGVILTVVFFLALSAIGAPFPWNILAIIVGVVLGGAVVRSSFIFVWRLLRRARSGAGASLAAVRSSIDSGRGQDSENPAQRAARAAEIRAARRTHPGSRLEEPQNSGAAAYARGYATAFYPPAQYAILATGFFVLFAVFKFFTDPLARSGLFVVFLIAGIVGAYVVGWWVAGPSRNALTLAGAGSSPLQFVLRAFAMVVAPVTIILALSVAGFSSAFDARMTQGLTPIAFALIFIGSIAVVFGLTRWVGGLIGFLLPRHRSLNAIAGFSDRLARFVALAGYAVVAVTAALLSISSGEAAIAIVWWLAAIGWIGVIASFVGGLGIATKKKWPQDRSGELAGELSSTAKETLEITRRLANGDPDLQMTQGDLVRSALDSAGHTDVSEGDIKVCLWPDRTALRIAEGFFAVDRPFARLQFKHVRSKWAAANAYNAVKMALLVGMAEHVTPQQHALAVAWNSQIGGEAWRMMYAAAQYDLVDMRGRDTTDPVAAYAAAIYLRSILREEDVDRYFPAEADVARAMSDASASIDAARSDL